MKRFEHTTTVVTDSQWDDASDNGFLDEMSDQGWELVTAQKGKPDVETAWVLFWKKPA